MVFRKVVLCIVLPLFLAACASMSDEEFQAKADQLTLADPIDFKEIDRAFELENYPRAKALIEQAVLARQTGVETDFYLALYHIETGQAVQGNAGMLRVLPKLDPVNSHAKLMQAYEALAKGALIQSDFQGTLDYLNRLDADRSDRLQPFMLRGVALDGLGRHGDAHALFREATVRFPKSYQAWNNMGFSLLLMNRPADAIDPLSRALLLAPSNVQARSNLRVALALIGDYETALRGVKPGELAMELNNVGVAAFARGDLDNAQAYLSRALSNRASFYEKARNNLELVLARKNGP